MANILDYLDWRGDIPFSCAPFNEVDNLILAKLSFIDFAGIVPPLAQDGGITLAAAAARYFSTHADTEEVGLLLSTQVPELLKKAAASPRFATARLYAYVNQVDAAREAQFSAVTFKLSDASIYVAFRGTDDTLIGWKEDFNMSFLPVIPSQQYALAYLRLAAQSHPRAKLRVGGHSKGGNLAVYSAVKVVAAVQRRILAVYNNDGPGFGSDLLSLPAHARIVERIFTIVPQSSVVGMLLAHEEAYQVVLSHQSGLMQHDGFSWEVRGPRFVHLDSVSEEGRFIDTTMKNLIATLSVQQREVFSDTLFEILSASNAQTLSDLREEGFKGASAMLRTYRELDKETQQVLTNFIKVLFRSGAQTMQESLSLGDRVKDLLHPPKRTKP